MCRSFRTKRLVLIATGFLTLTSCRAPFRTNVVDLQGTVRPGYYEGEALNLEVNWDAKQDHGKVVACHIRNTYSGKTEWEGEAEVPNVAPESLETLQFDPPLPPDGQLGLSPGAYEWVCDLDEWTRARTLFDILYR